MKGGVSSRACQLQQKSIGKDMREEVSIWEDKTIFIAMIVVMVNLEGMNI